ncbi:MAG TPA: nitronate monooxygenase [Gemmatimonadaceae bacterium]|nr:nitronate monooxygenase [Gemmatimonadaceae bacterium]
MLAAHAGIAVPLICGPMYPCSNPELVAAASEAGAIGVVQPVSLTYVHGHEYRAGLRYIRTLTSKPIGLNALIEASSRAYHERVVKFVNIALEEGVRFFITSLGNPRWVVDAAHAVGGIVYHDVTERKWALKARDGGVDGFIGVNNRAGGHAGGKTPEELLADVCDLGLPVVAAGGVATPAQFARMVSMGYAGVQMGTRFIATRECNASDGYKRGIIDAGEDDIVLTERLTGVPVAVINTPYIKRLGTKVGPMSRWLFRGRRSKKWMRSFYAVRAAYGLKRSLRAEQVGDEYWQAGKSVADIHDIVPAGDVVRAFAAALKTP